MSPPQFAGYTAVVTGSSGFVATELVSQLLTKGYRVRATVRSTKNAAKTAHLTRLAEVLPGKLTLHEGDLEKPGSFDEVVKGAEFVFHTASPYLLDVEDADVQRRLVKPAVEGTKNVFSSVVKSKDTVKRVVLTSSFAAVVKPKSGPANGSYFTEEDWNTDATPDKEWGYFLSKTLAEKAAWDEAKTHGIDLVTINPTGIFGPVQSERADAESVHMIKAVVEGGDTLYPWQANLIDVARAHVLAAEIPTAKGRYLVSHDHTIPDKAVIDALSERFPQYKFNHNAKDSQSNRFLDNSKVQKELGLSITSWQQGIIDMAVTLINKGVAVPVLA